MPTRGSEPPLPRAHFQVDRTRPALSVVIPVLEEEDVLPALITRLTHVLDELGVSAEVVFVDDGSEDGTVELIARAHRGDPRFRAICLSRNFGHQAAISAGLAEASGAAVVVMDGDLQDPPEAIPILWDALQQGNDVVYAVRSSRPEGWPKRLAYAGFYRLLRGMVSVPMPLDAGDFGILSRRVVDLLNELPERRRFVRGLRAWAGFRQVGIPIERERRGAGRPKYTWGKLVALAIDGMVGFSDAPLRWAGCIGLVAMVGSALGTAWALISGAPGGWYWVAMLVLFFGGTQLFSAAIIGEYVSRTLQEARGRPASVVRRRIGFESENPIAHGHRKPGLQTARRRA